MTTPLLQKLLSDAIEINNTWYAYIALLIGADVKRANRKYETPWLQAIIGSRLDMIDLFCKEKAISASEIKSNIGDISLYNRGISGVEHCKDSRLIKQLEKLPLHIAVYKNSSKMIKLFIKHGADINQKDKHNAQTALHIAARFKNYAALCTLLDHGATCHSVDKKGNTPLHYACCKNDHRVTKMILQKSPFNTIWCRNYKGYTPIELAVEYENISAVNIILASLSKSNIAALREEVMPRININFHNNRHVSDTQWQCLSLLYSYEIDKEEQDDYSTTSTLTSDSTIINR